MALSKFKVHNTLMWYVYAFSVITVIALANTSVMPHDDHFLSVVGMIQLFSYRQVCVPADGLACDGCLWFLCLNGYSRGVKNIVTRFGNFSLSLSLFLAKSGGLKENWTWSNFFSLRSHIIDFYVCIKPKQMAAHIVLWGQRCYLCIIMWAPSVLAHCMEGSRRKVGRKGDTEARASRPPRLKHRFSPWCKNCSSGKRNDQSYDQPHLSLLAPPPCSLMPSVSIHCLPCLRHRATHWSHEDKESLSQGLV